jgi:CheY-like chemotaxis protein
MIIFYVDDDPDDIEIFVDALKTTHSGISCSTARDGEEALTLLDAAIIPPDLIFIDINMPKVNGLEFLRALRSDIRFAKIPAIIYSTGLYDLDKIDQEKLGVMKVIKKHSNYRKLCLELRNLIAILQLNSGFTL